MSASKIYWWANVRGEMYIYHIIVTDSKGALHGHLFHFLGRLSIAYHFELLNLSSVQIASTSGIDKLFFQPFFIFQSCLIL